MRLQVGFSFLDLRSSSQSCFTKYKPPFANPSEPPGDNVDIRGINYITNLWLFVIGWLVENRDISNIKKASYGTEHKS